ncbi:hypothetical protein Aperf_G00000091223 [Anoplocephala perfoliata]
MGSPVDAYKLDAFKITHFKLVREKEDLDKDETFNPEMTHQIFGPSEVIFGYKDLSLTIAYMAGSLATYVDVKYSELVPQSLADGVQPDNIYKSLKDVYTAGFTTDRSEFLKEFDDELKFEPFGNLEKSYKINGCGDYREFCVYYVDIHSPDYSEFTKYLHRLEPFLLFFVDEARYLDLDDRWCFYVLYEKFRSQSSTNDRYAFVGYVSVYAFYAYPENIRLRKMGHATRLLEVIYDRVISLPKAVDITFEGPAEDLIRLRDYLDSRRCLQLTHTLPILREAQELAQSPFKDETAEPSSPDDDVPPASKRRRLTATSADSTFCTLMRKFSELARSRLKLSRSQCRRVFRILVYFLLDRSNPSALDTYRKIILHRTRIEYQLSRRISAALLVGEMPATYDEQYERELEAQVEADFTAYKHVTEKLKKAMEIGELEIPEAC